MEDPADLAWVRLGLARDRLIFWSNPAAPHLVVQRLRDLIEAALPDPHAAVFEEQRAATQAGDAIVELVLPNGRRLRMPADLPDPLLRRLVDRLGC